MRHLESLWPPFRTYAMNAETKKSKVVYQWRSTNRKAFALISAVRPYLVIKGAQADIATEFQNGVEQRNYGRLMPQVEFDRRERLYWAIRALNARGPAATTEREDAL